MSYEILYSDMFLREIKPLAKKYPSLKQDIQNLIVELTDSPDTGISLGNNLFKIRLKITSKGRGKSGVARVITCVIHKNEQVLLADIYDKSEHSSIDEKTILKNLKAEGFDL
ncbi:hypothetical protein [Mucilaginibacter psychrotolerans]|uniref:Addiction module toxin RelE n=1 Tax=Mucilaginibacter psychrotolerans TaxID=1524096 RepID=A0A4Y8SBW6_9SPHI|nr:hypothetical protein [Mucilaginibacter psychrotolerans]TFF35934.1 hypothetical protein E2R66_17095 [Mucilaginibacter psychrotolerans]